MLDDINRAPRRCKLCGKFFVPYQFNAQYCKNPNPGYNNMPCATIGSRAEYRKSHSFYETELGKQYEKNYKAYSKWVQDNTDFVNAYFFRKASNDSERQSILSELSENLSNWRKETNNATKKYEEGDISYEELKSKIALPDFESRSPKLKQLRNPKKK